MENEDVNENSNVVILEKSEKPFDQTWPTFEDFWNEYDKKVGAKKKLEKKWLKLPQEVKEKIMGYIPKYKKSQPEKKFRKNPETFLNNESWEDELISSSKQPILASEIAKEKIYGQHS